MICNLIKSIRPQLKRDPVSIVFGSAISAVGGMASSAMAASSASAQNDKQRQWATNEWNRQFILQNAHQLNQYNRQLEDYRDEWTRQFNMQNEYNSPAAQAERLRAAGFNPSMMMSNGSSSTSMPVSTPLPQTPTTPVPGTPNIGNFNPQYSGFADAITSIGSMFKDLAEARRNGAETKSIESKIGGEVELLYQQVLGEQLANSRKNLDNTFLSKTMDTRIKKVYQDYMNACAEEMIYGLQASDIEADIAIKAQEKLLKEVLTEKTIKDKELVILDIQNYQEMFNARVDELRSRAKVNKHQSDILEWQDSMNKTDENIKGLKGEFAAMANSGKISEKEYELLQTVVEKARYAADHKEFDYWYGKAIGILDRVIDGADAVGQFMNTRGFVKVARQNANTKQERLRMKESTYEGSPGNRVKIVRPISDYNQ